MQKIENFEKIDTKSGQIVFNEPKVGAYLVRITKVENKPSYQSLMVYFDIVEGEYKDYYKKAIEEGRTDHSGTWRSYKEGNSQIYFKKFIEAIESSNSGYKWNWDENTLVGKLIGAIYGNEKYIKDDPENKKVEIKEIIKCQSWCSVDDLKTKNYKLPKNRELSDIQKEKYDELVAKYSGKVEEPKPEFNEKDLPF